MVIQRHQNCQDHGCKICLKDIQTLGDEIESRLGLHHLDHLGEYRKWLDANDIPSETAWGWATPEVFDEKNVSAFISSWTEG